MASDATRARLSVGLLAILLGACSSVTSRPSSKPPAAVCPTSFAAANGAACVMEGKTCDYLFACAPFAAPAACACMHGTFVCTLAAPADAGSVAPCLPPVGGPPCPVTEARAAAASCSELGQQCAYPSACASIPSYDVCQCVSGTTANDSPVFSCTPSCEVLDASGRSNVDAAANPIPDAGGAATRMTDGTTTDATTTDATTADATVPSSSDGAVGQ